MTPKSIHAIACDHCWRTVGRSALAGLTVLSMLAGSGTAQDVDSSAAKEAVETSLPARENFHLYLLVGQSNMAGRGQVEPEDRRAHPRVLTLNKELEWVPATDPLHFDKPSVVGVGLGRTFGIEMAEDNPEITIGLIPCAAGGSPISSWKPGGFHSQTKSHPYDDALKRAREAMNRGTLKGVLWHQGESDSKQELADSYRDNLHALIARLRKDLSTPDVPFVAGQMGQFDERPWDRFKTTVDKAHRELPDEVSHTAFVSSDGLQHRGDEVHFDSAGYRELGRRYAKAMRRLTSSNARESAVSKERMNFVFFLVDDLGWADLGCYGSTFHETPNIDRLCKSGMKFTHGYAACPVCSPTRASIMTGRHPVRVDITDWIPGQNADRNPKAKFRHINDRDNLALEEVTIAEVLKDNGYQTFFAGKWHLGGEGFWPTDQGFDINVGGCDKGSPPGGYYAPWKNPTLQAKAEGEYLTERLTEESLDFLQERDPDQPFLLYLSYYNVHTPITPYKKRIEEFSAKATGEFSDPTPSIVEHEGRTRTRQDNAAYASMVAAVDDSVGRILQRLDELDLDDNTTVFFFSDNGGLSTLARIGPTSNLPLRAGKGWLYEGGVREPTIIRAPGVTRAGTVCETPMVSMDFFPTILDLAEISLRPQLHADGQSLLPLLKGQTPKSDRDFYWHYPHYHGSTWKPGASVRSGDWKLIEFYHYDAVELYHLGDDPGELTDVGQENPKIRDELLGLLHAWQKRTNAKMPVPVERND